VILLEERRKLLNVIGTERREFARCQPLRDPGRLPDGIAANTARIKGIHRSAIDPLPLMPTEDSRAE
jgi:hypothetical protein